MEFFEMKFDEKLIGKVAKKLTKDPSICFDMDHFKKTGCDRGLGL